MPLTGLYLIDVLLRGRPDLLPSVVAHLLLPAVTLATIPAASIAKISRGAMLDALHADYIRTAGAKGASWWRIVWRHAVRNALLPMVTLIALELGFIVGGALLVEVIFSWPGIGLAMYSAIGQRDYPMLQGGFLILTVSVILLNFAADLLYFRLDPRIST
jgi:peptide/nickel transport system permease protein